MDVVVEWFDQNDIDRQKSTAAGHHHQLVSADRADDDSRPGVSLGWRYMIDACIEAGLLVRVTDASASHGGGYYVISPNDRAQNHAARLFTRWLFEQAERRRRPDLSETQRMRQRMRASNLSFQKKSLSLAWGSRGAAVRLDSDRGKRPCKERFPARRACRSMRQCSRRRAIVATVIGNGLEWFDFTVYSFFAVIIAKLFFRPATN